MNNKEFGKRLKKIRKKRGMTQFDFGKFCGVDETTISKYENGAFIPTTKTLIKLSEILSVSCDYLLGVSDSKEILKLNDNLSGLI